MPGLLTLNTDLKSLKYGHDQPNGGSSREPYIKVDINSVDATFNTVRLTKFDDGLVRGGMVGALNASVVDTLRISKFFADFSKGPLFLTKQVGLQLSNPQLEHRDTLPTNRTGTNRPTRGQGLFNNIGNAVTNVVTAVGAFISNTANRIENEVGPTRIYNSGVNTLSQTPLNAFGGHIVRHGFTPNEDPSKYYEAVVTQNNFQNDHNRLEQYASNFGLGGMDTLINKTDYNTDTLIASYVGGPSSVYGIGKTFIRRWTNTNDKFKIEFAKNQSNIFAGRTRGDNNDAKEIEFGLDRLLGASNHTGSIFSISGSSILPLTNDDNNIPVSLRNNIASNLDKNNTNRAVQDTVKIKNTVDYGLSNKTGSDFSSNSFPDLPIQVNNPNASFIYNPASNSDIANSSYPSWANNVSFWHKNENDLVANGPSSYPDLNNPTASFKNLLDQPNTAYDYGSPAALKYTTLQNQISQYIKNSQKTSLTNDINDGGSNNKSAKNYIYNSGTKLAFNRTGKGESDEDANNDALAIIFSPIDPFGGTYYPINFLAYLTDYTDNFDSTWGDVKYVGRAEKFYIFNEFKRSISFGFNIPCFTSSSLARQHAKLNNLSSILAGTYNNGLLGGIITNLKLGNYVDNQPGIITSLNFSPIQEASWDLDKKLAYYIKVSINFTLIHNMLPKYGAKFINYDNKSNPLPKKKKKAQIIIPDDPSGISGGRSRDNFIGPIQPSTVSTKAPTTNQVTQQQYVSYKYNVEGDIAGEYNSDGNLI